MEIGKVIASNIRAERNRCKMSQNEVCEILGITNRTYIDYEEDASRIRVSTLAKLSEIFNCKIDAFFMNL